MSPSALLVNKTRTAGEIATDVCCSSWKYSPALVVMLWYMIFASGFVIWRSLSISPTVVTLLSKSTSVLESSNIHMFRKHTCFLNSGRWNTQSNGQGYVRPNCPRVCTGRLFLLKVYHRQQKPTSHEQSHTSRCSALHWFQPLYDSLETLHCSCETQFPGILQYLFASLMSNLHGQAPHHELQAIRRH